MTTQLQEQAKDAGLEDDDELDKIYNQVAPDEKDEDSGDKEAAAAKEAADKKAADEVAEAKAAEEAAKKGEVKEEPEDELTTLRRTAREQKRELDNLKAKAEETAKALEKAGLTEPPSPEEIAKAEEAQAAMQMKLDVLLEAMELSPKYEDVRTVVSQDNFDDLVEMMAAYVVETEGGKLNQRVNEITGAIWGLPNPYKYMYEKIKEFHPKYRKPADEEGKAKDGKEGKPPDGKEEKPPAKLPGKVPGNITDIPGGGDGNKGWTSARIDALDEEDLHKVPADIYEKYLQNELP